MRITVIGATGMVGSRIVAEAASRGHEVAAASRASAIPPQSGARCHAGLGRHGGRSSIH